MGEARRGDSSPILKPFEFSLNWKPHFDTAHTATVFLLFNKNKRWKSRRYCNKFHTYLPATYAFSVTETRHQRSNPACVCGNQYRSHRGTAFRELKTEVPKTWIFLPMTVFQYYLCHNEPGKKVSLFSNKLTDPSPLLSLFLFFVLT